MTPQNHMKIYEAKINLRRFEEVEPLISADATFTDGTHHGIADIRAAFEKTWQKLANETYWLADVDWIAIADSAASCTYSFHWKADIDGKIFQGSGRGTTVLRMESEGWKIIHEHLSRFPG